MKHFSKILIPKKKIEKIAKLSKPENWKKKGMGRNYGCDIILGGQLQHMFVE